MIKSILTQIETPEEPAATSISNSLMEFSVRIANAFSARLNFIITQDRTSKSKGALSKRQNKDRNDNIRDLKITDDERYNNCETEYVDSTDIHFINHKTAFYDLAVLLRAKNQRKPIHQIASYECDRAIQSRCPVLSVPQASQIHFPFKRPLVLLSLRPESFRALSDAIPLLAQASHVSILAANDPKRREDSSQFKQIRYDLNQYLSTYNINWEIEYYSERELLREASTALNSKKHDLLVMGAFGRNYLQDAKSCGEAKSLYEKSSVPVFISY